MNKFNSKSKAEQIFIMMMLSVFCLGFAALTGCSGKSCETMKCNTANEDGVFMAGVSAPGCGGCLSSGKGCNSCLWAQSYKCVAGSERGEVEVVNEEDNVQTETESMKIIGCDAHYYGEGCAGCGQKEKTSYAGCVNWQYPNNDVSGCFYGSTDKEEKLIGCRKGCGGCGDSDGLGRLGLDIIEEGTEIK